MIPGWDSQLEVGRCPRSTHKESSLSHTQEYSTDDQALVARHGSCTDGDDTPRNHDSADPLAWREVLHTAYQSKSA